MVRRGVRGGMLRPLSRSDLEAIDGASIEILEQVGVQVKSQMMVDVFKAGGAEFDPAKSRVRIPAHIARESLRKTPRKIILAGRTEANDLDLEDGGPTSDLGERQRLTPSTLTLETSSPQRVRTSSRPRYSAMRCRTCPCDVARGRLGCAA